MTHKGNKTIKGGGFFFGQWRRMYAYDKVRTGQGLQNLILNMHQNRFSLFEHCFLSVLPLSPPPLLFLIVFCWKAEKDG